MKNWPCGRYSLNTRKVGGLREVVASLEPRGEKTGPCLVFWGVCSRWYREPQDGERVIFIMNSDCVGNAVYETACFFYGSNGSNTGKDLE